MIGIRADWYYRELFVFFVDRAVSIYNGWYFLAHERVRMDAIR